MVKTDKPVEQLPAIPNKRYFPIGEVSQLCAVKPHVLRYWEQEFSMLRPTKRKGSRRYYQKRDILLVRKIRELLYDQGFTISGARQQLKLVKFSEEELALKPTTATQTQASVKQSQPSITATKDYPRQEQQLIAEHIPQLRQQLESLLAELKD